MTKKVTSKRVVGKASKVSQDKRSQRGERVSPRVKKGVDVTIDLYREALKELEKY